MDDMDNSYDVETDEEQSVDDPDPSREDSPVLFTQDENSLGKTKNIDSGKG